MQLIMGPPSKVECLRDWSENGKHREDGKRGQSEGWSDREVHKKGKSEEKWEKESVGEGMGLVERK